ncbi:hypothetical protein DIPPA_15104 [Diplonema papillatum]|nr:hypothetical protein DIPPA_15104 [Diplonema papillatum]
MDGYGYFGVRGQDGVSHAGSPGGMSGYRPAHDGRVVPYGYAGAGEYGGPVMRYPTQGPVVPQRRGAEQPAKQAFPASEKRVEPTLVVAGVLAADAERVLGFFKRVGPVAFERVVSSKIWLRYSNSKDTAHALAKNGTPILEGVWVSVAVDELPPAARPSPTPTKAPTAKPLIVPSAAAQEPMPLPAASLTPHLVAATPSEAVRPPVALRPHLALRWFLFKKGPRLPKRDAFGSPIPDPLFDGQQMKHTIPLPIGLEPVPKKPRFQ